MKFSFTNKIELREFKNNEMCFFWDKACGYGVKTIRTIGDFKIMSGWRYSWHLRKFTKYSCIWNYVEEKKKEEKILNELKGK